MKTKNKITIILLFVMSLYVTHGLFPVHLDEHHHDVAEYVNEFQTSAPCSDICDCDVVFHQVFLLPQNIILPDEILISLLPLPKQNLYSFKSSLELLRPPIS
jgi:hypothetical protein